jgi:dissimilatory sulfite reductase related protein
MKMSQITVNGKNIDVNEEGYFTDPTQWDEEIAKYLAEEIGLKLSDIHMEVLKHLREENAKGTALSIRKVGKSGIVDIKEFYELFPGGPLKKSSYVAGIPKPASCV